MLTIGIELNVTYGNDNAYACPYNESYKSGLAIDSYGNVCKNLCPNLFPYRALDFANDGISTVMEINIYYEALSTAMVQYLHFTYTILVKSFNM